MERKPFTFPMDGLPFTLEDTRVEKKSHIINGEAAYRDAAGNAHPVIRQFILRCGIVNYLDKVLKQRWTDWHNQMLQENALKLSEDGAEADQKQTAAKEELHKLVVELHKKLSEAHRYLKREMNDLFNYISDKQDMWNCKEYFKVKDALELANKDLIKFASSKLED
ncbi:uncharacterized protein LOC117586568 [Drosophila guanche]|uniref:Uncharacterized protein n=1 Tax=Drosophila guanche TaxID=7266 RepID=A0A3B0KFF8_DROGU|nr:uncharacterized protein LOC117586568 [Drosophila guanche]SPP83791.1 Hypothetical predicted protein [Drosophila guanche]